MKKAVLTLITATCCLYSFAQTTFQKTFGGTGDDRDAYCIPVTSGGFVTVGATNSFGVGGFDLLVLRSDDMMNTIWSKTFGGSQDEKISDRKPLQRVQETNDGGYIIAGYTKSFGAGNSDVYVIRIDSTGNLQWSKTYGGPAEDFAVAVFELPGGGFLLGGATRTFSFGSRDVYLIRIDNNGNLLWTKTFGGGAHDAMWGMDATNDGGFIIAGAFRSFGPGFNAGFLCKIDSLGNIEWFKTYGGNNDEALGSVISIDGGYIATGRTNSSGSGDYDAWIVKTDSIGNVLWAKTYGGAAFDLFEKIIADTDGNLIALGQTESFGAGLSDIFLVKTDSAGNLLWAMTYGGADDDIARSLQQLSDGGFHISGYTRSFGAGGWDLYFINTDANGNSGCNESVATPAVLTFNPAIISPVPLTTSGGVTSTPATQVTSPSVQDSVLCPLFTTSVIDETCEAAGEGSIDLTITGGVPPYTFLWSNGATTEDIDSLTAGEYIVTVTDSLGNMAVDTAVINDPPPDPKDPPSCSEVFISEYIEGSGHNKAIELYNSSSDDTVALNKYFLRVFMNGAPTPLIQQLVGILLPQQTFVIAHPNADAAILAVADQTANKLNFNGDDAVQLVRVLNDITIDIDSIEGIGGNPHAIFDTLDLDTIDHVGIPGVWPGNQGYPVGSGTTKNSTLIRKAGVTTGKEDWACGQKQWKVNGTDDYANLKQHICKCAPVPVIQFSSKIGVGAESLGPFGVQLDISEVAQGAISVDVFSVTGLSTCITNEATEIDDYNLSGHLNIIWITGDALSKNFSVHIIDDNIGEGTEYACFKFKINYGTATIGDNDVHTFSIQDNDPQGVSELPGNTIKIYPSVVDDKLFIEGAKNLEKFIITMHSVLGQTVMTNVIDANNDRIIYNVKHLSPGMYFVSFKDGNDIITKKFFKQ
ncbi:MAG TPA: T9SS type A sorting domain-containing protein [bacterium]|nr:T9SS type A sorting domain-containing protein [bacterium]